MQRRGTRTRVLVSVLLSTLVLGTTAACSGGDDTPPAADRSSGSDRATPEPAALTVKAGSLQGFLPKARHERVVADVAGVVDGWVEQAYVAGPWPREVTGVWDAFTPGAARTAQKDATLTSGAHYGQRVEAVRPTRRELRVDLLARQGTPHAATVRVTLDLEVTPTQDAAQGSQDTQAEQDAQETQKVVLRGRVFLTRGKDGWKIFGHDLARGGW